MDYMTYGDEPSYKPVKVKTFIENIGYHNKYDVSLTNPHTNGFISIRENGDIEMFADNMLGIRVRTSDSSVNVYANKLNVNAQLNVEIAGKDAELKLIDDEDGTILSQKADYIGINSDRGIMIGNYMQVEDSDVTISAEKIYLNASDIVINGKSLKTE